MYAIRRHRAAIKAWCWRVRFSRRGVMYAKTFYDRACGGSKEAKAQAIAWRNERLAELKALTVLEFHKQKRSNNVSGVPGYIFIKDPSSRWASGRPRSGLTMARAGPSPFRYSSSEKKTLTVLLLRPDLNSWNGSRTARTCITL